jgi:hypothetical protein
MPTFVGMTLSRSAVQQVLTNNQRPKSQVGSYWVAYSTAEPPVITAVFYATADIPGRV